MNQDQVSEHNAPDPEATTGSSSLPSPTPQASTDWLLQELLVYENTLFIAAQITGNATRLKAFKKCRDQAIKAISAHLDDAVLAAQTNAVAWCVAQVDDMHMNDVGVDIDRAYKGIKNKLRDRYKVATGVDPAPSYPVKADLQHQQKSNHE